MTHAFCCCCFNCLKVPEKSQKWQKMRQKMLKSAIKSWKVLKRRHFIVSVILSPHAKRVGVPRARDFFLEFFSSSNFDSKRFKIVILLKNNMSAAIFKNDSRLFWGFLPSYLIFDISPTMACALASMIHFQIESNTSQ